MMNRLIRSIGRHATLLLLILILAPAVAYAQDEVSQETFTVNNTWMLVATFLAGLVIAVVSPWWKISGHGMMMGGTIVALTTSWGVVGLLFVPVGLAVCWSRIRLQDHTGPQVISGFIYGLAFLGSIYAWIVT